MKSTRESNEQTKGGHYGRLAGMAALSFITMYVLMYAMVDRLDNVYANLNQFYMAGLMTMPMFVIELILMRAMYAKRWLNPSIIATSVIATAAFWFGIRHQVGIVEQQFLRSMIPHHGGAILMCKQTEMIDARLLELCRQIVSSQVSEIEQMKAMLDE